MKTITTFPDKVQYCKFMDMLNKKGISYEIIDPEPAYSIIGIPAVVLDEQARSAMASDNEAFLCSGWVEYRDYGHSVPPNPPKIFQEDLFGHFSISSIAPCIADPDRLRIICGFKGDISNVMPYINSEMPSGMFVKDGPHFTYMDSYHMVSLYPHRITVAKTDDIIDTWHVLEKIRCMINDVWSRKDAITPSYEMRQKPPALEIFKRLPGISCGECGQKTCMAFALLLWQGMLKPTLCKPVFSGNYTYLKDAFLSICTGLGIKADQ
jgi:ArsR family metal-binding transcriptional regulator